jgi:hypothetical protein
VTAVTGRRFWHNSLLDKRFCEPTLAIVLDGLFIVREEEMLKDTYVLCLSNTVRDGGFEV